MTLRIQTLGGLDISLDGQPLAGLKTRKAQALLVYLACQPGAAFSREHLQGLLWADSDKKRAAASLRQVLSGLRRALPEGMLLLDGLEVTFSAQADCRLDAAQLHDQPERVTGDFLHGFVAGDAPLWEEWLYSQRERIRLAALDGLLAKGEALAADEPAAAIPLYQQALLLEPWRESTHRELMRLYWRTGDRAAALRQYDECCRALAVELDVEPSPETAELAGRIQSGEELFAHNLPHPETLPSFVGRKAEIRAIGEMLGKYRLVTLTGLGGMGKTRLAMEAGRAALGRFPDGVCWVDLVGVQPGQLTVHLAGALGFHLRGQKAPLEQLLELLGERQRLLILDNFEPLLEDATALAAVRGLLAEGPSLLLLITSRQRLNLRHESVFTVGGLVEETDADQLAPDIQLFAQRARQADSSFLLNDGNRGDVARICALVESMPLGIEMAASWVRLLDVASIAAEIERDVAFLQATQQDRPDRHQRLEAVFDHAWGLLPPVEQTILQALACFQPGFDPKAARAVSNASLKNLLSLVDGSLLQRMDGQRFRLHERLRQYVAEKRTTPAQREAVGDAHARYYLGWLAGHKSSITGPQQADVMDAIDPAMDNIRAAWSWAVQRRMVEALAHAAPPLHTYQTTRSRFWEAAAMNREALEILENDPASAIPPGQRLIPRLLISLGGAVRLLGQTADAEAYIQRAVALAKESGEHQSYALALASLGNLYIEMGRNREALALISQALDIYATLDDLPNQMLAFNSLGVTHNGMGNNPGAREAYQHCRALALRVGHRRALAYTLNNLGVVADEEGEPELALAYYLEALEPFKQLGEGRMIGMVSSNIGNIFLDRKEWEQAQEWYESGLQAIAGSGEQWVRTLLLVGKGDCLRAQGHLDEAEQTLAQSIAISRGLKDPAQEAYGETYLARVAHARRNAAQARRRLRRAVALAQKSPPPLLEALAEWAFVAIDLLGQREKSLSWLLAVQQHPAIDFDNQSAIRARLAGYSAQAVEEARSAGLPAVESLVAEVLASEDEAAGYGAGRKVRSLRAQARH